MAGAENANSSEEEIDAMLLGILLEDHIFYGRLLICFSVFSTGAKVHCCVLRLLEETGQAANSRSVLPDLTLQAELRNFIFILEIRGCSNLAIDTFGYCRMG